MAARRLLILMLVLLGLSTLAAALMDPGDGGRDESGSAATGTTATQTTAEAEGPPKAADGEGPASRQVDAAPDPPEGKRLGLTIEIGRKVKVVPVGVGDQLSLRVRWDREGLVEIPALGLLEPVAPGAPARFDVLAVEPANYGIRLLEPARLVGRIEVTARGKDASKRAKRPSRRER